MTVVMLDVRCTFEYLRGCDRLRQGPEGIGPAARYHFETIGGFGSEVA